MIDLRGSIPSFILITDGKYHDSNVLDAIKHMQDTIYPMDKACVDFEALFRLNRAGAYFVTGAKTSIQYYAVELNGNMDETTGLRADKTIVLTGYKSKKLYPDNLRLVEYYDSEKDVLPIFLSNSFEATALEIACLYKIRWQIEVFFKWIKQNLTT